MSERPKLHTVDNLLDKEKMEAMGDMLFSDLRMFQPARLTGAVLAYLVIRVLMSSQYQGRDMLVAFDVFAEGVRQTLKEQIE